MHLILTTKASVSTVWKFSNHTKGILSSPQLSWENQLYKTILSKLILHPDLNIMIASFRNVKTTKLQVKITQRKLLSMLAGPCS
jgi:hypothetical protein